jgi:hypothetical protein
MMSGYNVSLTGRQDLEALFRSKRDRLDNAEKKKLKGTIRTSYLDGKMKLSKAIELTKGQGRRSENEG